MLVLRPDYSEQLDVSALIVVILQCLEKDVIGHTEARDMLFVNKIGAGK